jgi:hypothetical protein
MTHFLTLLNPLGKPKLQLEIVMLEKMIADLSDHDDFVEVFGESYASTAGGALKVFHAIWNLGWVNETDRSATLDRSWGNRLEQDASLIENLSEDDAHELLSWMARGNKWADAFFGYHAQDGNVDRLLRRLLETKRERVQAPNIGSDMYVSPMALRDDLVRAALWWQQLFGVAPSITSTISEFDAVRLVGMKVEDYSRYMADKTAVSKGCDFVFNEIRYQVKANRPSGKPGSSVTKVAKVNNYDWDQLIWINYDTRFVPQEAWLWNVRSYRKDFEYKERLAPEDYRKGSKLDLSVLF